jgi:cytochrome c556
MTMKNELIVAAWVAAVVSVMGMSNVQAVSPASYMYILMVNMVGPAGNSLSQTAAIETLRDQDWNRVEQLAARLNQSAEAVSSGGTAPADIERAKSREWKAWAGKFSDAVSLTVNAAERRDKAALVAAADELAEACKGCHSAFPQAAR